MQALKELITQHIGVEAWLAMLVAIALVALLVSTLARLLLNQLDRLAHRSNTLWDESLVSAARLPLHGLIWLLAGIGMARVLHAQWPDFDLMEEITQVRNVGVVIAASLFVWSFIGKMTRSTIARGRESGQDFDVTTVHALSKLARLVLLIVAVITVAHNVGLNIGALLALGGVGGLAVGLAAKDLLANFFGGLTIYLDRPFSVGDWIRSPDKSIEGTVEYISWRHTRIRAFNKNPIYVPNAVFTTIVVENPSRMSHRRLKETVGVRYDDFAQIEAIASDIRNMLNGHPEIDTSQTLIVNFNAFSASSLDIMIYTFTKTTNWVKFHEVKQAVLIEIGRIIEGHGAEIAYPTQTLHLAQPLDMPAGEGASKA